MRRLNITPATSKFTTKLIIFTNRLMSGNADRKCVREFGAKTTKILEAFVLISAQMRNRMNVVTWQNAEDISKQNLEHVKKCERNIFSEYQFGHSWIVSSFNEIQPINRTLFI